MPTIFTTDPDSPYDVELAGVGVLGGSARGGIPAEQAAEVLHELQDDDGEPLKGQALTKAAEDFAKSRGLKTKTAKSIDIEKLRVESGAFPAGLSIREVVDQAMERDRVSVQAHEAASAASPLTVEDLPPQETANQPPLNPPKED